MQKHLTSLLAAGVWLAASNFSDAAAVGAVARTAEEFRQAVAQATPGTRILLAPGAYPGGFYFSNLQGETNRPIIIAAADPAHPPVIQGAATGLHFSKPAFLELHDLVISNLTVNGLNIDDAGSFDTPAHHLVLRGLKVSDAGPRGNHDCIKLSGVVDFRVKNCLIERWGTGGGSGIDMVGCHRGVIESNLFRHTDAIGSTGVQAKGGTSQLAVRRNRFENAGGRAVNIGGSTGLKFFRPPLIPGETHFEAKDIRVEGNTFIGGGAPVAFVGIDGAIVRFNTIYHPKRWALRILQENRAPDFVPSRNGEFTDNLVAFDSRDWAEGGVNIGSGTAPQTFTFARNWWYCLDEPGRSRPRLPVNEVDGVYGKSPLFRDAAQGDVRVQPGTPASNVGADADWNSAEIRPAKPRTVRVAGLVLKWLRGDKAANFHRIEPLIREAAARKAQIICTTECFLDGYAIADKSIPLEQYRALGEPIPQGEYIRKLAGLAKELKIFLIAGMLEADGEHRFNTAALISPSGELIGKYHKQHLEHEAVRNTAGNQSSVFATPFGKVGVMICADRRLPRVVKGFCERGADFLICPSGGMFGPKSNDHILQARSKENGKFIVFVHPAEFLVTGPDGALVERSLLGDKLLISPDQIGTAADSQRVCCFDLPLPPAEWSR